jgi:eukaryotic-like serine/threonine-protein kinase
MPNFEMTFMAIASKNSFLTHEEAAEALAEFNNQAGGGPRQSIEEIVLAHGLLTAEQVRIISSGAKKILGVQTGAPKPSTQRIPTQPPAGGAVPTPRPGTQRIPTQPPPKPNPAEPIPGIRISGKLGVGGTATVFLADDLRNNRKVALKIMHPSLAKDEKAVRRFQRESTLLVSFDHPNLVKGHSQGTMGPLPYLVMECLEGESAQETLDREKHLSEARSLEIIQEAAKAIDYMQSKKIIHRDIKPGNIYLLKDGRVKVIDLGFAQEMGTVAAGDEETTSGTVQYMSPEQARGQLDLDVRADIYSLGATLYHMVMGETPFSGTDSVEVMAKQVMEALSSAGMKNKRISKHMHYFIERMMSKDKNLRYSTPHELVDDVNEQIDGFRSLEYRPQEGERQDSHIMRAMEEGRPGTRRIGPPSTTRRIQPPGSPPPSTRRIATLDDLKKRLKKK